MLFICFLEAVSKDSQHTFTWAAGKKARTGECVKSVKSALHLRAICGAHCAWNQWIKTKVCDSMEWGVVRTCRCVGGQAHGTVLNQHLSPTKAICVA